MTKRSRYLSTAVSIFVLLVIVGYVWHNYLEDRIFPKRFGIVEPGVLYRSGQISPTLIKKTLQAHHIKVVVNLQFDDGSAAQLAESDAVKQLAIEQYRFPLNGNGTGDIKQYAAAIAHIQQAVNDNKAVLVHCAAGAQRTGGVIAAWQTLVQKEPVATAIDGMEKYGWKPVKNRVLAEYLDQNMATLAQDLVSLHVIDHVPNPLPNFEAHLPH